MKLNTFLSISSILFFVACGPSSTATKTAGTKSSLDAGSSKSRWVDSTLKSLSLEEKVAQMVVFATAGEYLPEDSDRWQELERLTMERKLGGFAFSIGDVYEYAVQLNKLQRLAKVPLLIACDFEYGPGMRINHSTKFPHPMAVGATHNPQFAYEMGKATAEESRAVGVQQNYAPVADVNTNPMNPVINTRSFGDDADLVASMAEQFVKGTQDGGVIATVKHFPGHGDTDIDTHLALVTLNADTSRIQQFELKPFKQAIAAGALSVMVGHIAVPAYDSLPGIPGTVSPVVITKLLKGMLRYDGLIITDAMRMQSISKRYGPAESAVLSVKAGTDIVLAPTDPDIAIDAIVLAVKRGEISEERINYSVRKQLHLKQWAGLDRNRFVDIDHVGEVVGSRNHQMIANDIARNAVTVLGDKDGVLPLSHTDKRMMLDVVFADSEDPQDGRPFHDMIRNRHGAIGYARIDPRSNVTEFDSVRSRAKQAGILLLQLHFSMRSGQMSGFMDQKQIQLIQDLLQLHKPTVAVSFGNPYLVRDFPQINAYVCGYSDAECIQQAAAEVLFAENPAKGKLPVTIPGAFSFGDGVEYPKTALRSGPPEEVGFDPKKLAEVSDVVNSAIRDSAFPGGVLLIAKNGVILHDKAYGTYDYTRSSQPVDINTMYDLASLSKVVATTSAVMRLVDEGKIHLDDAVVKYIPQFGQQEKDKITVYNLMVHNSGMPAWRRFYDFCSEPQCVLDSLYATHLVYKTGDSSVYSDLGLITLGKIIEKISGKSLDMYVDSVFFKALGMRSTMYNPPKELFEHIAPTEVDTFWKRTGVAVRGRVHDENAALLGGVSGHAGLFSTASDLAIIMQMLLNKGTYDGKRYLNDKTVEMFTQRQSDKSSRGIGWDTKSPKNSWAGSLLSDKTFLHTGFTGTSVAADPEQGLIIILLTNRVYPSRSFQRIAEVRPKVHDAIMRALIQ